MQHVPTLIFSGSLGDTGGTPGDTGETPGDSREMSGDSSKGGSGEDGGTRGGPRSVVSDIVLEMFCVNSIGLLLGVTKSTKIQIQCKHEL